MSAKHRTRMFQLLAPALKNGADWVSVPTHALANVLADFYRSESRCNKVEANLRRILKRKSK